MASNAPKWSDISASPKFKSASAEEQDQFKRAYFADFVAPTIEDPDKIDLGWQEFQQLTTPPSVMSRAGAAIKDAITTPVEAPAEAGFVDRAIASGKQVIGNLADAFDPRDKPLMTEADGKPAPRQLSPAEQELAAKALARKGAPPEKSWVGKQAGYTGTNVKVAWNNLLNTADGMRAQEFGDLIQAMENSYTPDQIAADPALSAEYAARKQKLAEYLQATHARNRETAALMKSARPETQQLLSAGKKEGLGTQLYEIGDALISNPVGVITDLGMQSLPQSLATISAAVMARFAGAGPVGASITGGASSAMLDFGNEYARERLEGKGHDEATKAAAIKSSVVGLFDAASFHTAGKALDKVVSAAVGSRLKTAAGETLREANRQGVLGAGGEAVGSLAAGKETDVSELAAEYLGEFATGPFEAVATVRDLKSPEQRFAEGLDRTVESGQFDQADLDQFTRESLNPNRSDAVIAPEQRTPFLPEQQAAARPIPSIPEASPVAQPGDPAPVSNPIAGELASIEGVPDETQNAEVPVVRDAAPGGAVVSEVQGQESTAAQQPAGAPGRPVTLLDKPASSYSPASLALLQIHPDASIRDAAAAETKRREVEAAYAQQEQAKAAQTVAIAKETAELTADQAVALSEQPTLTSPLQAAFQKAGIEVPASLPEGKAPADNDTDRVNDLLEQRYGRNFTAVTPQSLPDLGSRVSGGELGKREATALSDLAARLGHQVVFFRGEGSGKAPSGFIDPSDRSRIFVNVRKGAEGHAVVFGHELLHQIRRNNKALYQSFLKAAAPAIGLTPAKFKAFSESYGLKLSEDKMLEELHADLFGNRFAEPKFWEDVSRNLAEANPSMLRKFLAAITDVINRIKKMVGGQAQFEADMLARDLEPIRRAAAKVLAEYAAKGKTRENQATSKAARPEKGTTDSTERTPAQGVQDVREGDGRAVRPQVSYGTPRAGATSVAGIHFSRDQRGTLSSLFYGTGIAGEEAARLAEADPRLKHRLYFYVNEGSGIRPEAGVGTHAHAAELRNVYDMDADPLGLRAKAGNSLNAFEVSVLDAGFDGYYAAKAFNNQGGAVLLGSHSFAPEYVGTKAPEYAPPVRAQKAAWKLLKEEVANDKRLPIGEFTKERFEQLAPDLFAKIKGYDLPARGYKSDFAKAVTIPESTERKLLAPNGKPSKLTAEQHAQVRTSAFKAWFGDWEKYATMQGGVWNDGAKEVSKVVDEETGEPLVVYHGSPDAGFAVFEPSVRLGGSFFTDNRRIATSYSGLRAGEAAIDPEGDRDRGIYSAFLNIRNPGEEYFEGANWDGEYHGDEKEIYSEQDGEWLYAEDGSRAMDEDQAEVVLATAPNDSYEIRDAAGPGRSTDSVVAEAAEYGHDGVLIHDVVDNGPRAEVWESSNVFVIFDANQVKSAVANNGNFSKVLDDIRESTERKKASTADHKLQTERQERKTVKTAALSPEEESVIQKAAEATGIAAKRIRDEVKRVKADHPASAGWAPLELATEKGAPGVDPKAVKERIAKGGYTAANVPIADLLNWQVVPYDFNKDTTGKDDEKTRAKRISKLSGAIAKDMEAVYIRAAQGDQNAKVILRQAGWYKNMRGRLRHEFGGLGDLFADLLGAASPNTPVRTNWDFAVEALRLATQGKFDDKVAAIEAWRVGVEAAEHDLRQYVDQVKGSMSLKAMKEADQYKALLARYKAAQEIDNELLPLRANGKKFGINSKNVLLAISDMWRIISAGNPDIAKGGTAPKARNFSGNLIGFSTRATIDVWAARYLRRMAAENFSATQFKRIPPPAEKSVSGKWEERDGKDTITLEFGFGQDVFAAAAEKLRASGVKEFAQTGDDDLQAMVWFLEKEKWTVNNWTNFAGEGGSFELEADLAGVADRGRISELRRVLDSSKPSIDEKAKASAELDAMKRSLDRYVAGYSIEIPGSRPMDFEMAKVRGDFEDAVWSSDADDRVVAFHALSTIGRYGEDERSFDFGLIARNGYDANKALLPLLKSAKEEGQHSTLFLRQLRADENVDPLQHRPGLEVYFDAAKDLEAAQPVLDALNKNGLQMFTFLVNQHRKAAALKGQMPATVGVRFVFSPEFEGWNVSSTNDEIAAKMNQARSSLDDLAEKLSAVAGVSYVARTQYEGGFYFWNEYADRIGDIEGRSGAGDQEVWSGRSVREQLEAADRSFGADESELVARRAGVVQRRDAERRARPEVTESTLRSPLARAFMAISEAGGHQVKATSSAKDLKTVLDEMSEGLAQGIALNHDGGNELIFGARRADGKGTMDVTVHKANTQSPYVTIFPNRGTVAGSHMYQMVMAWAHNNGKTLFPDSSLSTINRLRRSEAMISSMLRHRTTRHVEPSIYQFVGMLPSHEYKKLVLRPDGKGEMEQQLLGINGADTKLQALKDELWTKASGDVRLTNMLVAATRLALYRAPELQRFHLTPEGQIYEFENGKWKREPLTAEQRQQLERRFAVDWEKAASLVGGAGGGGRLPASQSGVGRTTVLRALLTKSLLSELDPARLDGAVMGRGAGEGLRRPEFLAGRDTWSVALQGDLAGLTGAFAGDPLLYSTERGPVFFSQLARGVAQAKAENQPAAQWKLWLTANQSKLGIKAEEIQWTGISEWLDLQGKAKVSKQQVLDYLDQNGVQVVDVLRGDQGFDEDNPSLPEGQGMRIVTNEDGAVEVLAKNGRVIGVGKDEWHALHDAYSGNPGLWEKGTETKYKQYSLPGGKNYKELLLTLPGGEPLRPSEAMDFIRVQGIDPEDEYGFTNNTDYIPVAIDMGWKKDRKPGYYSSHWTEPNIVAHVRFDERTDADGKRVLFIEELQSDWGQEGKKKGFDVKPPMGHKPVSDQEWKEFHANMREAAAQALLKKLAGMDNFSYDIAASVVLAQPHRQVAEWAGMTQEWEDLIARRELDRRVSGHKAVPSGPFVADTKSWLALGIKRMIRYAAENGFDKVAFVNGEQSADRYDLSQQVAVINAGMAADGQYLIGADDKHGNTIIDTKVPKEKLEDTVGKELAKRIIDEVVDESTNAEYRGLDLKLGGEGMKAFYDQIVPQVANDVLKKLGGGKMGVVEMVRPNASRRDEVLAEIEAEEGKPRKRTSRLAQPGFEITDAMRDKALAGQPLFSPARKAIARLDAAIDGLQNLPDQFDYMKDRYLALGKIARVDEITAEIRQTFRDVPQADKQAVYAYLTTRGANSATIGPVELRAAAVKIKQTINLVGDQLVARGLLDPAARAHYRDQYLPRMYLKHLLSDQEWKMIGAGKKPSEMGYLKHRKDIAPEVRELVLGEIKDPAFLSANAIGRSMRDIALLDWLARISQNQNWIFPGVMVPFRGQTVSAYWLKAEAERIENQIPHYTPANQQRAAALVTQMRQTAQAAIQAVNSNADVDHTLFKQIPDTNRYGLMRGLLVRKEIYQDIMGLNGVVNADPTWFESFFGIGHLGTRLTQYWKFSKVAANPPGQIRNFVSNMVMLQLSGIGLHRMPVRFIQAARDVINDGPYWKVAKKYGVTESTFTAQELYRIKRDLVELESQVSKMHPLSFLKVAALRLFDGLSNAYQFSEALGKTMKIMDEMKAGKTEAEAAIEAQKWLFDYSLVPQWVRVARNSPVGMPFVTYAVKVLPRLMEVAATAPWRFLPWMALLYGMQYTVAGMFGADYDDLEKLKKALPEWLRDKGHTVFLPFKDADGRVQVADVGYFFPWTQYSTMLKHGATEPGKLIGDIGAMFSAPIIGAGAALIANYDNFTRKPIYNPADPASYQAAAIANYLYDLAVPPIISSHGVVSPMGIVDKQYGGKGWQAATGTTNKFGDPKATPGQAIAAGLGLNFYGLDPDHSRATNLQLMVRKVLDAETRLKGRLMDRSLTSDQRAKAMADYRERMLELGNDAQKYAEESKVPEQLKARR